jgi:hypothetical protein
MFVHQMGMNRVRTGVLIGLGSVIAGCTSDNGVIGLGLSDFADEYSVVVIDTITVKASTILLDSIPTSGTACPRTLFGCDCITSNIQ